MKGVLHWKAASLSQRLDIEGVFCTLGMFLDLNIYVGNHNDCFWTELFQNANQDEWTGYSVSKQLSVFTYDQSHSWARLLVQGVVKKHLSCPWEAERFLESVNGYGNAMYNDPEISHLWAPTQTHGLCLWGAGWKAESAEERGGGVRYVHVKPGQTKTPCSWGQTTPHLSKQDK